MHPKNEQPSLSLPQPLIETTRLKAQTARPELDYQIPKAATIQPQTGAPSSALPVPPGGVNQIAASNQLSVPTYSNNPASDQVPHAAGDIDLMEKEWMIRAKHLLSKNLNSPYEQSKEITQLKAAYLKKRFNKDIITTDG